MSAPHPTTVLARCKLCGELVAIHTTTTLHEADGEYQECAIPQADLADLYEHLWAHQTQGEGFPA